MTERLDGAPEDLEGLVAHKEVKLPSGIRKYIRRLKAEGRLEEAMSVGRQTRQNKSQRREDKARAQLHQSIFDLLTTDDPETDGVTTIKAIWLLYATGEIDPDERLEELQASLDAMTSPIRAQIEARLVEIRDQTTSLMPSRSRRL
jgi:hypothetical protein